MKRFFRFPAIMLALGILTILSRSAVAQTSITTSLQFLHLAADPAVSPISVWGGVPVFGSVQFFRAAPSVSFREATPAITGVANPLLPGMQIPASLFIDSLLSANLTPVSNTTATPTIQGGRFIGLRLRRGANISLIRGVIDPTGFAQNPNGRDIRLNPSPLVDTVQPASTSTRIVFYHAVTDAPEIDVVVRETGDIIAQNASFDQAFAYNIPNGNYTLDVYQSSTKALLGSYSVPFRTLGYDGQRIVLAATGFLNPAANRNGPALGFVTVPNTEIQAQAFVLRTAPPPPAGSALPAISLQAIHASADPTLSPIAFWLNTMPFGGAQFFPISTNLPFRSATTVRTSLSAGTLQLPLQGNTDRPTDALITAVTSGTLPGASIIRVANYVIAPRANFTLLEGVGDTTRFARNPSGRSIRFQLRTLTDTATSVAGNQTRLLVANSVTDLADILLDVRDATGTPIVTLGPLSYGLSYVTISFPVGNYTIAMRPSGSNTVLGSFSLNLQSENLGGKRLLLTATGFANPAQNLGGPGVRILAAVNDSTGRFFLLPGGFTSVREEQGAHNVNAGMRLLPISPNPVRESATIRYELSESKEVACSVVDAQGAVVWSAERTWLAAGAQTLTLDASAFVQGAYTVRLTDAQGNMVSARLVVVR